MDKLTAMGYLRNVILERFPPGPDRQRWLAWLTAFSRAEETPQTLSGLLISSGDDPPHTH
jgi:hypothetical protein